MDEDPRRGIYNLIRPVTRIKFDENQKRMDLSSFSMNKGNDNFFKKGYQMLDISQLEFFIDSMNILVQQQKAYFAHSLFTSYYYLSNNYDTLHHYSAAELKTVNPDPLSDLESVEKNNVINFALNAARNQKENLEFNRQDYINQEKMKWKYEIEWHRKFSLSFACLVLFLIGAPLGSIIRKGGLGFPMVFSVVVFIFFWIINITGEKFAREGIVPASVGMWISTAILLRSVCFCYGKQQPIRNSLMPNHGKSGWYIWIIK